MSHTSMLELPYANVHYSTILGELRSNCSNQHNLCLCEIGPKHDQSRALPGLRHTWGRAMLVLPQCGRPNPCVTRPHLPMPGIASFRSNQSAGERRAPKIHRFFCATVPSLSQCPQRSSPLVVSTLSLWSQTYF